LLYVGQRSTSFKELSGSSFTPKVNKYYNEKNTPTPIPGAGFGANTVFDATPNAFIASVEVFSSWRLIIPSIYY